MTEPRQTHAEERVDLRSLLEEWQLLEERGIQALSKLRAQTRNRALRQVLSIIMHDSTQHRRVQGILLDGLENGTFDLSPAEVNAIWSGIEEHEKLERASIAKANFARKATDDPVIRYFLTYMWADEEKHHRMLGGLEELKATSTRTDTGH